MKKTVLMLIASVMISTVFAQGDNAPSEKYIKAMESLVPAVDTTISMEGLTELANSFERIANAEKTQWLPYYYASFSHVMKGFNSIGKVFGENADIMEAEAEKAEALLSIAEKLAAENSEILCIKNMIAGLKIMVNPAVNGMKYGQEAEMYLEKAKKADTENPRVYFLAGQSAMYKPAEWGGGPEIALEELQTALEKYESFKPLSSIHPNWGRKGTEVLISRLKNK